MVMMRKIAKSSERRKEVSWSTPMMIPLSMSTAVPEEARQHLHHCRGTPKGGKRTKWVKVDRDPHTLRDTLVRVPLLVDLDLLDRKCVEPNADLRPVPPPERVLERPDSRKVCPVELDPVGEDLEVVFDFLVCGTTRAKEDEFPVDEENDGRDVEVVRWVAESCFNHGKFRKVKR